MALLLGRIDGKLWIFNITCEEVIEKGYINRYYRGEKESIIMEQYFYESG